MVVVVVVVLVVVIVVVVVVVVVAVAVAVVVKRRHRFKWPLTADLIETRLQWEKRAARNITVIYFQRCTRLRLPLITLMVTSIYFRHQLIVICHRIMGLNMRTILLWLQVVS